MQPGRRPHPLAMVMCNLGGPPVSAPERVGGSAPSTNVASTMTSSSTPSAAGNTRAQASPLLALAVLNGEGRRGRG
jgi:hypothetical protein